MKTRESVLASVALLASAAEQVEYEREAPQAFVPGELVELAEDIFRPKHAPYLDAFTEAELRHLAHVYGLLREVSLEGVGSVADLQKLPAWRRVMIVAKDVMDRLG